MNILLVCLMVILIWRIAAGMKRGIVREIIALVNISFSAIVIALVCLVMSAYHAKDYLAIVIAIVVIVVISVVYSVLKVLFFSAKVISKLPVISSADRLLGFAIGAAETLVLFWTLCCVLMYVDLGIWEEQLWVMIRENKLLTGLYQYNLLGVLLDTVKNKLLHLM